MLITGRYPGVPSDMIKPYAIPEEGTQADIHRIPPPQVSTVNQVPRRKDPKTLSACSTWMKRSCP